MPTLTAKRELRYAGRTILPGGEFEASDKDAKLLIAIGKATRDGEARKAVDLPKAAFVPPVDEMAELRARYQEVVGKRPFGAWDADTIRERMATYQRRDMRAGD